MIVAKQTQSLFASANALGYHVLLMFDWLTNNLTEEQKDSLSKFILSKEELDVVS